MRGRSRVGAGESLLPAVPVRHLLIHGRVQGVGYRWSMAFEAERLGVTGWVRNRRDGTVEAVISGDEAALDKLFDWAERGPPGAHVTKVDIHAASGEFFRFEQHPTV